MRRLPAILADALPVWVTLAGAAGWILPESAAHLGDPTAVRWMLALIMLGMGITLSVEDFRRILRRPRDIVIAALAQYTIMPGLAWGISEAMGLPAGLAAGLILVGCAPGGTASNLVTYLAKADTALSVLMTAASTALAAFATPWLTHLLAGRHLPVDIWGLMADTATIIIAPVAIGVALNRLAPRAVAAAAQFAPLVSVITIAAIVAGIVGRNTGTIALAAIPMVTAVLLLHAGGFALGLLAGRACGWDTARRRALSIEVGMQNSGLATSLAQRHFPTEPTAAAVGAVSAICQCLVGSALSAWWRRSQDSLASPRPSPPPAG